MNKVVSHLRGLPRAVEDNSTRSRLAGNRLQVLSHAGGDWSKMSVAVAGVEKDTAPPWLTSG